MAAVKLRLRPRHQRWLTRYNPAACTVSRALSETYGGRWAVGYGTARRKGFFSGVTLRLGADAREAVSRHDEGRRVGSRTVTLYGNPGPTLEEQAEAKRKAAAAKRAAASSRNRPAAAPAGKPGFWAALWNPSAAERQAAPQPAPRQVTYRTPAAAERARRQAASR